MPDDVPESAACRPPRSSRCSARSSTPAAPAGARFPTRPEPSDPMPADRDEAAGRSRYIAATRGQASRCTQARPPSTWVASGRRTGRDRDSRPVTRAVGWPGTHGPRSRRVAGGGTVRRATSSAGSEPASTRSHDAKAVACPTSVTVCARRLRRPGRPIGFLYANELYRRHGDLSHLCLYEIGVGRGVPRAAGVGRQLFDALGVARPQTGHLARLRGHEHARNRDAHGARCDKVGGARRAANERPSLFARLPRSDAVGVRGGVARPYAPGRCLTGHQDGSRVRCATRFCELAGVRHPIVQTGMGWVSGARLTAATSAAGGLGILAAVTMTDESCAPPCAR